MALASLLGAMVHEAGAARLQAGRIVDLERRRSGLLADDPAASEETTRRLRAVLGEAQRAAAGAYVPLVLWFNFVAGFAYVAAGIGLWQGRSWAAPLAVAVAAATALVFAAFGLHVLLGGAYEMRTVAALALRLAVWSGIAWFAWPRRPDPARPA
jgi:hypothetical protein